MHYGAVILVIYDDEGNPIKLAKVAVNLVTAVHREESYPPLKKDFYPETNTNEDEWKREHSVEVNNITSDANLVLKTPAPSLSFESLPFPPKLQNAIAKHGFSEPTPVQSASLPLVLSGRDVIGSSPTGSGKTCCYIWPFIVHSLAQPYRCS